MRAAWPLLGAVIITSCAPPAVRPEEIWLKDWALSRCVAKAAKGEAFGRDAELTAGAFLERGNVKEFATYEKLERLADEFLAHPGGGSVHGDYNLLKCIELYQSRDVDRIARDAK